MRVPSALLPLASAFWLLVLAAAPLAVARSAAPVLTVAVYRSASFLCPQLAERSFTVAGVQMPVCGRCTGLYASAAIGAAGAWLLGRRVNRSARTARVMLAAAAVPMAISLGAEWIGLVTGSNGSRFLSALPLGLAAGWLLQSAADDRISFTQA